MKDFRNLSRRDLLKSTAVAGLAASVPSSVFAQGSSTLKIGLIGCGGRGTGAANDCISSSPGVEIVAMGDAFQDRLTSSADNLQGAVKDKFKVTKDKMFVGFDAYQKVLACDIDLVVLATPPGFRPFHLEAAIKAGKHVFMEKPVAVDGAGVQKVFDAADLAKSKRLSIVAGTQRRHQFPYVETIKRVHAGQIGDIVSMSCYWNQGGLWMLPRQPDWSDLHWQLKNWLYFTWLSGDHICEQHIHNIDVCLWAKGKVPVKAVGHGGRQSRTDPAYGHIFDHFAIEYSFDDGTILHSYCRQQEGTASNVSERLVGTKGVSNGTSISGEKPFKYEGANPNPYVQEHADLIAGIRAGKLLNEGHQVAESTLAAIMGRLAAYTGQEVTREQALQSKSTMVPELSFGAHLDVPAVAVPGQTKLELYI